MATFDTYVTVDGKFFLTSFTEADGLSANMPTVHTGNFQFHTGTKYLGTVFAPAPYISSANFTSNPPFNSTLPSSLAGTSTGLSQTNQENYGFAAPTTLTINEVDGLKYVMAFFVRHVMTSTTKHRINLCLGFFKQTSTSNEAGKWTIYPHQFYKFEGTADNLSDFYGTLDTLGSFCFNGIPSASGTTMFSYYALDQVFPAYTGCQGTNPVGPLITQYAILKASKYQLTDDPYGPMDPSGPGGGGGTFTPSSDPITIPPIPTLTSAHTGFTRIYNPTLDQVRQLANYLWTDTSVIATIWNHIKQFFEDPMDAMICFNIVPVTVPDGGNANFALMYIDTGVQMNVAASQFVDVSCGTLELKPYYGSALDYSPYTKISLFLPFIGTVSINTDEVMGRTIGIAYRVDIVSGNCVAYVMVDGNALYQYSGNCAINIPFSSADFSTYMGACISIAKLGATLLSAGSAGIADAVGGIANDIIQGSGDAPPSAPTKENSTPTVTATRASFAGLAGQQISNTVSAVMSAKPHIEHSGSFSGNSGYLGVRRPYVIIERPRACMPANYNHYNGYPCMMTLKLGDCTGYTKVQQIYLENVIATNPEISEIVQLLKAGVII